MTSERFTLFELTKPGSPGYVWAYYTQKPYSRQFTEE